MKVMIRLYRQHDLDLIGLWLSPTFDLKEAMYNVLCDYVRGSYYHVGVSMAKPESSLRNRYSLHITLDEERDADVIAWLQNTVKGQRNSMLKNLFRGYLINVNMFPYRDDDNGKSAENVLWNALEKTEIKEFPRTKKKRRRKAKSENLADKILGGSSGYEAAVEGRAVNLTEGDKILHTDNATELSSKVTDSEAKKISSYPCEEETADNYEHPACEPVMQQIISPSETKEADNEISQVSVSVPCLSATEVVDETHPFKNNNEDNEDDDIFSMFEDLAGTFT